MTDTATIDTAIADAAARIDVDAAPAGSCCDTATLSTCCEPSAKSSCCGAPAADVQATPPTTCSCS